MPTRANITIAFGSSTLELELKPGQDGLASWTKHRAPSIVDLPSKQVDIPNFARGAGASHHKEGFYAIGTNVDCRDGFAAPGPREVIDLTGIAANFRVVLMGKHADTNIAIATDGTTTRVYRKETTWVTKVDQLDGGAQNQDLTGVATHAVSFKGVLAIALSSTPYGIGAPALSYVFTTATTATGQSWDFTTSTKTAANAKQATFFHVQMNGLIAPRVTYVVNPNEVYFTEDLTNGDATGSTASTIEDTQIAQTWFTSVTEDDSGVILFGMRRALYSMDSDGVVERLTPYFPDPIFEAGSGSNWANKQFDRGNFECFAHLDGRIYYNYSGYDILEYYHGQLNQFMAPKWTGQTIPRMQLPINAMTAAAGWLVVAMGTSQASTLYGVAHAHGGTALLGNTFGSTSELWAGRYQEDPTDGRLRWVWHGVLLVCTDLLRYMWWDEDDNYLYLASGAAESANLQMRRCLFGPTPGLYKLTSSNVVLNTGEWQLELGRMGNDTPTLVKELRKLEVFTRGLASTVPSLEAQYRVASEYSNTAYSGNSLATYVSNATAETGTAFPDGKTGRGVRLKFIGTGDATNNLYAILDSAILTWEGYPVQYDQIEITAYASTGKLRPTGARSSISGEGIKDLLNTWKTTQGIATLTEKASGGTGDTYEVKLADYRLRGVGAQQELSLVMVEMA